MLRLSQLAAAALIMQRLVILLIDIDDIVEKNVVSLVSLLEHASLEG